MTIAYTKPLSRALGRMKRALFQPFDIGKWLALGFAAFLAGLTDWNNGGGSGSGGKKDVDWRDIFDFPYLAWDWLCEHPGWFTLIIFGLLVLIALFVLLTWLSSRGKFMFLDNVIHNRANITKPWYDFRWLGNSLFVWRLCFGFICFGLFVLFLVFCYLTLYELYDSYAPRSMMILAILGLILAGMLLLTIMGYISLFLEDFVIPIMYRNNLSILTAWGRFISLFTGHVLHFLLYGLLVFSLHVLVVICVIAAGLLTCCLGLILLMIPYIGSVITLPISFTFRAFSLEFLQQFGPEYAIFPESIEAHASGET